MSTQYTLKGLWKTKVIIVGRSSLNSRRVLGCNKISEVSSIMPSSNDNFWFIFSLETTPSLFFSRNRPCLKLFLKSLATGSNQIETLLKFERLWLFSKKAWKDVCMFFLSRCRALSLRRLQIFWLVRLEFHHLRKRL